MVLEVPVARYIVEVACLVVIQRPSHGVLVRKVLVIIETSILGRKSEVSLFIELKSLLKEKNYGQHRHLPSIQGSPRGPFWS